MDIIGGDVLALLNWRRDPGLRTHCTVLGGCAGMCARDGISCRKIRLD